MSETERIHEILRPLLQQARDEGKWLRSDYQGLWFSPDELEAHHKNGMFLWGPINWILCDPEIQIANLERRVEEAQDRLDSFNRRVKAPPKDAGT